jgi:hypothetical protein
MHPTIYHHDWLIARVLNSWKEIREGYIHVVVTRSGVVVKRILNRVEKRARLVLQSDNDAYPTYEEPVEEVQQILEVKAKLSHNLCNESMDMRKDVNYLKTKILELQRDVDKLKHIH